MAESAVAQRTGTAKRDESQAAKRRERDRRGAERERLAGFRFLASEALPRPIDEVDADAGGERAERQESVHEESRSPMRVERGVRRSHRSAERNDESVQGSCRIRPRAQGVIEAVYYAFEVPAWPSSIPSAASTTISGCRSPIAAT
jgi:hypothetical protein